MKKRLAFNAGDVIGDRYEVIQHIGSGGMQDVFLAKDSLLSTEVALKTPQDGQPDARFTQSAILAARVNHHNVAKTLDCFEEEERLFLIEEYVPGETLEDKLKYFGVIDPHLAARIFHHLAKGVAASHHAGVVHRDLKPSNIIAEPGVNFNGLKITDFGIATLTDEVFTQAAQDGDITKSRSGTVKGALPYMAPEMMFRKANEHPGAPADVWSLGAMMFKLMTGEFPFGIGFEAAANVKNESRCDWPDFMTSNAQFSPLSIELQNIIDKCLVSASKKRPTADELVEELSLLCYVNVARTEGVVSRFIQNGYSGFADDKGGGIFFSIESVYGPRRPEVGKRIAYSRFPGNPKYRGHPIVVIGKTN